MGSNGISNSPIRAEIVSKDPLFVPVSLVAAHGVANPQWRFDEYRYQANLLYLKEPLKNPSVSSLLSLPRNIKIFTQSALNFLSSSQLLTCAAQADYWEEITALVYLGGMLNSELLSKLDENGKWVEIYRKATLRYLQDRIQGKVPSRSESSLSKGFSY